MTTQPNTAHWCETCDEIVTDELVRVYECDNCGTRSDERRCDQCNKFMRRADEDGCPECFSEVVEVEVVTDHDGTLIRLADYDPAGPSLAEREAARIAEAAAAADAKRQASAEAITAASHLTTWSQVRPGMRVADLDGDHFGPAAFDVLDIVTLTSDADLPEVIPGQHRAIRAGTILATVDRFGATAETHAPDELVRVMDDTTTPPAPFLLTTVENPHLWAGSGIRALTFSRTTCGDGLLAPIVAIYGAMHSGNGMQIQIAGFVCAADALAYAAAARDLADFLPDDGGRRDRDTDIDVRTEDVYFAASLTRIVRFEHGTDGQTPVASIVVGARERSMQSVSIADRKALIALADVATNAATWLNTHGAPTRA